MNDDGDRRTAETELRAAERPVEDTFRVSEVEPWEEAVDGDLLLQELAQILKRYVVLPKWGPEALALWALHTYAYDLRDVSTYVGVESPEKRCGKTTLLSVLSELVNRPVVAANISSPAFFRVIEEARPTLMIDEADTWLRGDEVLKGILNSGYTRKTAFVVRVTQRGRMAGERTGVDGCRSMRLARYSCWCPKVMAAIGRLPATLADRCILIRMQRKASGEECERLRGLEASALRRQCARFVLDHAETIRGACPELPRGLNDRAGDIWEPLLALADLAGGGWPGWAREAALELTATAQEANPTGALLLDIFLLFKLGEAERMSSREVVAELNQLEDRPWVELLRGRKLTEHWLAHQLRPFGVRPQTLWMGERAAKGYELGEILPACRRYARRLDLDEVLAEASLRAGSRESVMKKERDQEAELERLQAQVQEEILKMVQVRKPG